MGFCLQFYFFMINKATWFLISLFILLIKLKPLTFVLACLLAACSISCFLSFILSFSWSQSIAHCRFELLLVLLGFASQTLWLLSQTTSPRSVLVLRCSPIFWLSFGFVQWGLLSGDEREGKKTHPELSFSVSRQVVTMIHQWLYVHISWQVAFLFLRDGNRSYY